ncbi:MAG TPA: hypothetical protein VL361_24670 [Candidatus Limnocylindrales bacterium]|nr:hypothetical protein [Candidatus Limnocylindrales bacterium]
MRARSKPIRFRDALHVRSAEFWLKLGKPYLALLELQHLPDATQAHPWATVVWRQAVRSVRQAQQEN